ncbi:MAG: hypothetical protein IKD78_06860 [Bacteroidales bacterium]|nr:hypothetical protein [Bacteroidales bacterium]
MNKTLSNSEFAQMIAERFPALNPYDRDIMVFDETGNCAIYAKESKKGYSSVRLAGRYNKTYSSMTAAEKAAAIEYVLNLPVEIATINAGFSFGYYREYWVEGAKMKNIERDRNQFWYEKKKAEIVKIEKIY